MTSFLKQDNSPDYVYLDVNAYNYQSIDQPAPILQFSQTRNLPVLENSENYNLSITRFQLDTFNLPTFIAEIQPNQADPDFLKQVGEHGPFSIIVDDGSHEPKDILASLKGLWPHMHQQGKYFIDDTWHHGKKYHKELMDHLKSMIDEMYLTEDVLGFSVYPNLIVLTKGGTK